MSDDRGRAEIIAETLQVSEQFQPIVRRARYQRLTIYELDESELQLLENGSPDSPLLTIAIAMYTLAATLTVTLLTATFGSDAIQTAAIAVTVVGYVTGTILVGIWFRTRSAVSRCVRTIRDRLPPEWIMEPTAEESDFNLEA